MNGQWLGHKYGDKLNTDANLIADLDRVGDFYEGLVFHWPITPPYVCSVVGLRIPVTDNPFRTEALIWHDAGPNRLRLSYTTDLGDSGHSVMTRMAPDAKTSVQGLKVSWKDLKDRLFGSKYRSFIFRGQENANWPLRTLFHREGRANLFRYKDQDILTMFRRLSSILAQPFNIALDDDRGAFVHLMQHHGYPTPLLDWSFSPFVAAFFAFRNHRRINESVDGKYVRIYKFDLDGWVQRFEPVHLIATTRRNLSFLEFLMQNNPRAIPQQALSSVTSVDDVESYIRSREDYCKTQFLEAFDVPVSDAPIALADLRHMGITAGSLFPGVDGACEEMRALRFP